MAKSFCLDEIEIATPCPATWAGMEGDDRSRLCRACNKHVYDLSRLTRVEAVRLIAANEGKLCARLYRRADGRVLTADCPVGLRRAARNLEQRAQRTRSIIRRWVFTTSAAGLVGLAVVAELAPIRQMLFGRAMLGALAGDAISAPSKPRPQHRSLHPICYLTYSTEP